MDTKIQVDFQRLLTRDLGAWALPIHFIVAYMKGFLCFPIILLISLPFGRILRVFSSAMAFEVAI